MRNSGDVEKSTASARSGDRLAAASETNHTDKSHRLISQAKNHTALRILPGRKQNPQSRLICACHCERGTGFLPVGMVKGE
jgi:hypothetical protein